ncbi:MAG: elongation factor P [Omnitrophica WOR_2 bacterium GWF2_43_52]|nr:MAG: elongation factor P [Omnitrophica WOR_2 bacterium GWA2_44_7]OGX15031.1 MAG: elongation factor P [Omnitrophica WOR_2 bacterium GWC2_44_8]OGX22588.1 MAG: elongation factor P [Omnitrophica WOR_2 bacterium GWF2_43_52]OGX53783.1 MAG: elongation factor P [Omnitrophica WOR_2 bacterium RIFOXYC2_FULL_43_9]HAH21404.1 elongation factor P [Candidatus Omnitrophota bacterium]
MALSINQFKVGVTILLDGEVYQIVETEHVKPAKGSAFVRAKLKNLRTGNLLDRTFRGQDTAEEAFVEQRKLQYLYSQTDMYHFMDQENYDQLVISADILGDGTKFLKDNLEVLGYFYKDKILNVVIPNFIELVVTETEPGIKGDTAKGGNKPAKVETGATILVPLFINIGDKLKVDTRTGTYVERAY